MTVPPFPSQDLAKLVLGYLAEEQLMTAYDEFLQASPYLDAFGNEYDRIFMTSLKNILAEYRAVKIYVETCKPFHLRRKLFQCPNLLEMVKFLIQHVDLNKINVKEHNQTKCSAVKQNNYNVPNCDVCKSLKLETCSCSIKNSISSLSKDHNEESALDSSVETTALSDLPGNHVTERKKKVSVSDSIGSDLNAVNSLSTRLQNPSFESGEIVTNNSISSNVLPKAVQTNASQIDISLAKHTDPLQVQKKEEFSHVLNQVCHQNQYSSAAEKHNIVMGGYKNFATGVNANGGANGTIIVPDTSTTDKVYVQIPVSVESSVTCDKEMVPYMKQTRTQYLLKVAHVNNTTKPNEVVAINTTSTCTYPKVRSKTEENKVKILSDVKVDGSFNNNESSLKMPPVLKNATSTPLMQMQTIVINGTPVYKQKPTDQQTCNFTTDEIMAMPTIILAPATGLPTSVCNISSQNSNLPTTTNQPSTARSLSPLTIDITGDDTPLSNEANDKDDKPPADGNMPKLFDVVSASAPKDTATGTSETSTPQGLPPIKKSSSTPRRTSHVRVLDFTTPRRILHESMNKCVTKSNDLESVISQSHDIVNTIPTETVTKNNEQDIVCDSSKENQIENKKSVKKKNWDADLRALAVISEISSKDTSQLSNPTPKSKSKVTKKRESNKPSAKKEKVKQNKEKKSSKKRTTKDKKHVPEPEEEEVIEDKVTIPVKPTIKIISGDDSGGAKDRTSLESDKGQNKSNQDNVDTPELERMSLQNEIGAKLNISDLLETPYKQALYDIQMETPRFLGPDLPDDPMSDIKIMNIPTPKFLNAPTPSSYSSRPTDYSSGGSYYKPDDQDYMRVSDDFVCPVTSSVSKESMKSESSNDKETNKSENTESNNDKPTRPVRKCTKNVSYYNNSNLTNKTKEAADNINSSFSDMTDSSFCESTTEKEARNATTAKEKGKSRKSEINVSTKKRKSPVKKESSKSFMKIRPRRPTPSKKDIGKRKRKTPESVKTQGRRIAKKEEEKTGATPLITSAPTKSRRKSSTPRKLHCTKSFNSESSGHDSPELLAKTKESVPDPNLVTAHDSDTEQLPLRWSDDGSQDVKSKEIETNPSNESEDISKIQEYLKTAANDDYSNKEGRLHIDLVKRGFDLETAKIIERELLDSSPQAMQDFAVKSDVVTIPTTNSESITCASEIKDNTAPLEKTLESDCSTSNNLQIVQDDDEEEDDEIELAVHECNEDTGNFFLHSHDDTKEEPKKEIIKLKDKFSMEVCLDDDLSIRLRATPFSLLLDQDPDENLLNYNEHETEMAVRSISNMDKLYTPLKQSIKDQCYEIFDSTLTSLDTPLKPRSPKFREEVTVTEIVLEVESIGVREKVDTKKRKRAQSGNLSDENESKKVKPEAQYLLNSANIQNIDIESVLSKLHGP